MVNMNKKELKKEAEKFLEEFESKSYRARSMTNEQLFSAVLEALNYMKSEIVLAMSDGDCNTLYSYMRMFDAMPHTKLSSLLSEVCDRVENEDWF